MKINEIFYSIQGEGQWMGLPNIFIRTTGCNLRCSYCDTKYAYKNGDDMDFEMIFDCIKNYPSKYICITGGEPLIQKDTVELIDFLIKKNFFLSLETNGSISIKDLIEKKSLMISLDIKCPSSNMHKKMDFENISLLRDKDQIKFIIKNRNDYEYAKKIIKKFKLNVAIFFQPIWGGSLKNLSSWILKDGLEVRISIQLHKIIWGNRKSI